MKTDVFSDYFDEDILNHSDEVSSAKQELRKNDSLILYIYFRRDVEVKNSE